MSIQQGLIGLVCAALCVIFLGEAAEADHRPARSEEALISSFEGVGSQLQLDEATREIRIPFTIATDARPEAVELVLSAAPLSNRSNGRIEAFVNRARAVVLQPRAEDFEARFSLYSDDLRAGENELVLRLVGAVNDGWTIDTVRSRLRISAAPVDGYTSLDAIEAALNADFAAPRRVHIDASAAEEDALAVAALVAQGLALRMGEPPILVQDPAVAELIVYAQAGNGAGAPAIDLTGPSSVRLAAGQPGTLIAAARLFAARSMEGHDLRFDMASALQAPRLFSTSQSDVANSRLEDLAALGAPFGSDQGGRAAVVIVPGSHADDEAAALSVVARAALASGSAWLYAWYGNDVAEAPANHDLMVLGPQESLDPRLMAAAPAEVRAATMAASNRTPRRQFGSTAYASDNTVRSAQITGVAALYEEASGRKVALITAPEGADFARAAKRLARSELWTSLEGRAVVWDAAAVTPFGPSAAPQFSLEWASQLIRRNDEYFALGAFSLAIFLLLMGAGVNRSSRRET